MRGLLEYFGWGRTPDRPAEGPAAVEAIRRITEALEQMDREKARYIAAYAYLLARVAHADLDVSEAQTRAMQERVEALGGLPAEQAGLVVEIAKAQNALFGGAEGFAITQEFNRIATREQKVALLECLFAVSSAGETISTVEDNEIRGISRELRLDHEDFIRARSLFREHLGVLKKRPGAKAPEDAEV